MSKNFSAIIFALCVCTCSEAFAKAFSCVLIPVYKSALAKYLPSFESKLDNLGLEICSDAEIPLCAVLEFSGKGRLAEINRRDFEENAEVAIFILEEGKKRYANVIRYSYFSIKCFKDNTPRPPIRTFVILPAERRIEIPLPTVFSDICNKIGRLKILENPNLDKIVLELRFKNFPPPLEIRLAERLEISRADALRIFGPFVKNCAEK